MAKYKIAFSGFAYVEADDEEEAKENLEDGGEVYMEYTMDSVVEVDSFDIRW